MTPKTYDLGPNMVQAMREAASYMVQASALQKEIATLEETNPSDKAPAFKYLSLGHFKDLLCEYRTAAEHYERAAELYLIYGGVAVGSSSYFSAGKALYLSKDFTARFKALTLLNLAKNLDRASGDTNKEDHSESHKILEALIGELTASLKNHK